MSKQATDAIESVKNAFMKIHPFGIFEATEHHCEDGWWYEIALTDSDQFASVTDDPTYTLAKLFYVNGEYTFTNDTPFIFLKNEDANPSVVHYASTLDVARSSDFNTVRIKIIEMLTARANVLLQYWDEIFDKLDDRYKPIV